MSDMTSTVEERLAAIEQLLSVMPMANPPVTVGELTDVPAPGSSIASAWAQEVSNRILHRFANAAAMNAWAAANGSQAITLDNGKAYYRAASSWVAIPGLIGYSTLLTAQNGIDTNYALLSNILVSFTALTGRQYEMTAQVAVRQRVIQGLVYLDIYNNQAGVSLRETAQTVGADFYSFITATHVLSLAPGAAAIRLRVKTSNNTVDVNPGIGFCSLTVKDISL